MILDVFIELCFRHCPRNNAVFVGFGVFDQQLFFVFDQFSNVSEANTGQKVVSSANFWGLKGRETPSELPED